MVVGVEDDIHRQIVALVDQVTAVDERLRDRETGARRMKGQVTAADMSPSLGVG